MTVPMPPTASTVLAYAMALTDGETDAAMEVCDPYLHTAEDARLLLTATVVLAMHVSAYAGATLHLGVTDDAGNLIPAAGTDPNIAGFYMFATHLLASEGERALAVWEAYVGESADCTAEQATERVSFSMHMAARMLTAALTTTPGTGTTSTRLNPGPQA